MAISIGELVLVVKTHIVVQCALPGDWSNMFHYLLSLFSVWVVVKFAIRLLGMSSGCQRVCCPDAATPTSFKEYRECSKISIIMTVVATVVLIMMIVMVVITSGESCDV
eukprot:COSAG01_NODE_31232_length_601_cov_1.013944_1_plen_108_part_10